MSRQDGPRRRPAAPGRRPPEDHAALGRTKTSPPGRPASHLPALVPAPDGGTRARDVAAPPDLRPFTPAVLAVADKYGYDAEHARQVSDLALQVFLALPQVHRLGPDWAPLLEHAALLHDIGYFIRAEGHHRHSRYLIRHDALLTAYPQPWRDALALIARNHRKRPRPAPRSWGSARARAVLALATLLRIADGCDYGHDGAACLSGLRIRRGGLDVVVSGVHLAPLAPVLRRKSRLFAKTFALPVRFRSEA